MKSLDLTPKKYSCLQYFFAPSLTEVFHFISWPQDSHVVFTSGGLKPGTEMNKSQDQTDVLGCYLTTGNSYDQAMKNSVSLRNQVKVNGTHQVRF